MNQFDSDDLARRTTDFNSNNYNIQRANQYILEGKFSQAINIYEISLNQNNHQKVMSSYSYILHPKSYLTQIKDNQLLEVNPIIGLAICYSMTNNYQKGYKYFQALIANLNQSTVGLLGLAYLYSLEGHINKAIECYIQIYQKHPHKKQQALQQLIFLYFSQGDDQKSKYYLSKVTSFSNPQIKALSNFYQSNKSQQNVHNTQIFIDKNILNNYFIFKIQLLQLSKQSIIKLYSTCNVLLAQNVWIRDYLLLTIIKIYGNKGDSAKLLQFSKLLHENDKNNYLFMIYLAFALFNSGNYKQGLHYIIEAYQFLKKNDIAIMSKQNRQFLLQTIKDLLKYLQKAKFTTISYCKDNINQISAIFYSLFNKRDDSINSNIHNARFANNRILEMISTITKKNYQIANICKPIYQLYKKKQDYIQFIYLFFSRSIYKNLNKQKLKLQQVQSILQKALSQYNTNNISIQPQKEHNIPTIINKYDQYTIKYNPKIIDLFHLKCYFTNHKHLSFKIQDIIKNCYKMTLPIIKQFIQDIKNYDGLHAFDIKIKEKCTDNNKFIEINQIIEQLMPEINQYKQKFLQDVQIQLQLSQFTSLNHIAIIMLRQWSKLITKLLEERRQNRKPLKCMIQDWITVEITFANHLKLVNCLQFIQAWKKQNNYEIVNIKGDLRYSKQEVVNVVLNINKINCTIKLMVDSEYLLKRKYQLQLEKLSRCSVGLVFANLMNLNKIHKFSPNQYIQQAKQYFKNSKKTQQFDLSNHLNQFSEGIQFIISFDKILMYQKRPQSLFLSQNKSTISQSSINEQFSIEDSNHQNSKSIISKRKKSRTNSIENQQKPLKQQYLLIQNHKSPITSQKKVNIYQKMTISQIIQILQTLKIQKQALIIENQQRTQQLNNIINQNQQKSQQILKNSKQLQTIKEILFRKQQNNSDLIKKIMILQNKLKDYQQINKPNQKNIKNQLIYEQYKKKIQFKTLQIQSIKLNHIKQIQQIKSNNNNYLQQLKKQYQNKQVKLLQQKQKQKCQNNKLIHQQYQKIIQQKNYQIQLNKENNLKNIENINYKHQQQIQKLKIKSQNNQLQLKNKYQIKQKQLQNKIKEIIQKYQNCIKNIKNTAKNQIEQKSKQNQLYTKLLDETKEEIDADNYEDILEKVNGLKKQLKFKQMQLININKQKNKHRNNNNNCIFQTPKQQKTKKKNNYDEQQTQLQKQPYNYNQNQNQNIKNKLKQIIQQKNKIQKQNIKIKQQLQSIKLQMIQLKEQIKQLSQFNNNKLITIQNISLKYQKQIKNKQIQLQNINNNNIFLVKRLQNQLKTREKNKQKIVFMNNKNQWMKILLGIILFLSIGFNSILHLAR